MASLFERTLEEAYQKKRREGHREAAIKTARKLLARGMDPEEVAELVELSLEEVGAVQDEQR